MAALNNKILIGTNDESTASYVFENTNIYSVDGEMAVGVIGDELTIDTLTPVVRFISDSDSLWSADLDSLQSADEDDLYSAGELRLSIAYGTAVYWYNNGTLSGKFYVESIERTGREQYQLNCISVIGMLDTQEFVGGVYTNKPFATVLQQILSGTLSMSEYEVDSDVQSVRVYGWLPYGNRRECLHKLLMAYNVSMVKSETDASKIRFCFLGSDSTTEIPDDRIYNDGSVDYGNMPTCVSITEHTYINWPEGSEEVELFNNTDSGICDELGEIVVFDEPIIPSTVRATGTIEGTWELNDDEGLGRVNPYTIETVGTYKTFYKYTVDDEGNVGWSSGTSIQLVSAKSDTFLGMYFYDSSTQQYRKVTQSTWGTTTCRLYYKVALTKPTSRKVPDVVYDNYAVVSGVGALYGKPYIHQSRVTSYSTGASGANNAASLTDNTLITAQNGRNVADRLIDYYGNADTQKVEIKMSGEKIGKKYTFQNAFNEMQTGLLARITLSISSFVKGICEIITGLLYPGKGTLYNRTVLYLNDGTFTIPSGVTKLRAVLIGGGSGGDSGYAGEDGEDATTSGGNGGEGGNGGNGGKGGRIYSVELSVTPGDTISYTVGAGGAGGVGATATHDTNVAGSEGGASTMTYNGTEYSSADGAASESGYCEFISNNIYAKPNLEIGAKGGNGGKGGTFIDSNDLNAAKGEDGESVCEFAGGSGGLLTTRFTNTFYDGSTSSTPYSLLPLVVTLTTGKMRLGLSGIRYHGTGGGGGACATAVGYDGTGAWGTGTETRDTTSSGVTSTFKTLVNGMNGGYGRKPDAAITDISYGGGGAGGHGGGGGGGGGATNTNPTTAAVNNDAVLETPFSINATTEFASSTARIGKGGIGGEGGNGGDGKLGCVIFYYAQ